LWGTVPDADIQRLVLSAPDPQSACDQLVQAANAAGGPDNITVILVYFPTE
jgi:serine/threonine protein phosphatase PrpC